MRSLRAECTTTLIGPISLIGQPSRFYRPRTISRLRIFSESSRTCPNSAGSLLATTELAARAGSSPILSVSLCGGPGPAPSTGEELHDSALHACAAPVGCGQAAGWLARGLDRAQVRP